MEQKKFNIELRNGNLNHGPVVQWCATLRQSTLRQVFKEIAKICHHQIFHFKAGFTIKFYFDSKFAIQLFKGLVVNVIYGHFHSILFLFWILRVRKNFYLTRVLSDSKIFVRKNWFEVKNLTKLSTFRNSENKVFWQCHQS